MLFFEFVSNFNMEGVIRKVFKSWIRSVFLLFVYLVNVSRYENKYVVHFISFFQKINMGDIQNIR